MEHPISRPSCRNLLASQLLSYFENRSLADRLSYVMVIMVKTPRFASLEAITPALRYHWAMDVQAAI